MDTYAFQDTQATISGPGGLFELGAGAGSADEGITIERAEDKSTMVVGADGSVMHSLHAGKPATITVRLLKTSPVNGQLTAMYNLQTSAAALHGQNVFTLRTVRGDLIVATQVAFKRHAATNYGKDGGFMDWMFDAGRIDSVLAQ